MTRVGPWTVGFLAVALLDCSTSRGFIDNDSGGNQLDNSVPTDTGATDTREAFVPDRVIMRTNRDIVLPGAPADSPDRFGGTEETSRAPSFVYPQDQTIIPPNLPSFEIHYNPGTNNNLFQIVFEGQSQVVRFFTPCTAVGSGCALTLEGDNLAAVATAAAPTGSVRMEISGTSSTDSSAFGRSESRTLGVTQTEMRGAIYFWVDSGQIVRYEFGRPGARLELFLSGDPINCAGCHSLARNGARIAVGRGIPGPAITSVIDIQTRAPQGSAFGANFGAFNPDASLFLSSDGSRMSLLNASTGAAATGLPPGVSGSMPDWSPNGSFAVFARSTGFGIPIGTPGINAPADLLTMPFTNGVFRTATTLVQSTGENNYYPSISPDNEWVVFNRSSGESFHANDAALWLVRADGNGSPVVLANANLRDFSGNSWPKWTPFQETYTTANRREPLMWITYSSRREYGLRLAGQQRDQLWMAAVRPGLAQSGQDPSAPAFWLPVQNLGEGNHIAQWVSDVPRTECMLDSQCPLDELCQAGTCVGGPP